MAVGHRREGRRADGGLHREVDRRHQERPKPYNTGDGMRDIADWAEQQGVEIFYSTPAAQLVQNESGAVTGVIAEGADGYIQFNAAKGVIVATGDYENDDEMMADD